MEYIKLNNGIKMPLLGFGTARMAGEQCEEAVWKALQAGYRCIDTAHMYKNEKEVGNAIIQSGIPREELFIASKIFETCRSYEKAKQGIKQSLQDLQVDYLDLMLVHEPYAEALEMYKALEEAYKEGKIRAIGVSNFDQQFYTEFIKKCEVIPAVNQVEAHIYFQQTSLQEVLRAYGTVLQGWSTFTNGVRDLRKETVLQGLSVKYGKSVYQIVLRYFIQKNIAVIPMSLHEHEMKENLNVFDFVLSEEDMAMIKSVDEGKSLFR